MKFQLDNFKQHAHKSFFAGLVLRIRISWEFYFIAKCFLCLYMIIWLCKASLLAHQNQLAIIILWAKKYNELFSNFFFLLANSISCKTWNLKIHFSIDCFTKVIGNKLLIEKSCKSNKSCKMLEETKTKSQ